VALLTAALPAGSVLRVFSRTVAEKESEISEISEISPSAWLDGVGKRRVG
jgi:hypothetical protein